MNMKNVLCGRLEFYEDRNNAPSESLWWALMCKWVWRFWCLTRKNVQFMRSGFIKKYELKNQSLELKLFMADISSGFMLSFSSSPLLQPSFYQVELVDSVLIVCLFLCLCVPTCIYPPLIQPWAAFVPCRLNVSSLTLMSSHNLFVCLCGLPRCPHNVRQSIIMWPTYLPRLPTALVIRPLACTAPISDLPEPLKKALSLPSFPLLPIMPV